MQTRLEWVCGSGGIAPRIFNLVIEGVIGRFHAPTVVLLETYEGVTKSFRTDRLERELQMVQLSATRCSCIAIL